ncbi:MAG: PD40 domain-containing protein [Bacteroidia bacterium]|nr:PD40 domain-containing protein [Bacteroidia bacterium]
MRNKNYLFVAFILICSSVFAQEYKRHFIEGNLLLLEENYSRALTEFQKAYAFDSASANINFKIGFCYLKHPTEKHLAESYLEKAVKDVTKSYDEEDPFQKSSPPMAYLYLGQAFHLDYKFEDALKMYETYQSYLNPKRFKEEIELVEHYKKMAHFAIERVGAPANVQITNMGDSVNSEYPDFSPILSADERMLIFTHAGKGSTGAESGFRTPDDGFFEDIFVSYKKDDGSWTEAKILHPAVNGMGHEGAVGITPDGQTLLVYRDDNGDGNLYYSTWDGVDWSPLNKFGPQINSEHWEPSACFSPDGEMLYFVSNRPGGFGGRDIYRCKKNPSGGWFQAQNLGPKINTRWDEESPFVHPNGEDFFFSSQGHSSMGGFDIMFSIMDSVGGFGDVIPLPYPINTTDDDEFYVSSPDNKRAYYASAHEDRTGFGEQDIYMITMSDAIDPKDVVVLFTGKFIPAQGDSLPSGLSVVVTNKSNPNEPVAINRPQRNGNFTAILRASTTYLFSYQLNGQEFFKEEIVVPDEVSFDKIDREVPLKGVIVGQVKEGQKLLLDVLVLNNSKDKKPVAGASVEVTDKDGKTETLTTNGDGKVTAYKLNKDNAYKIAANAEGKFSDATKVITMGMNVSNTFSKTLYLNKGKTTVEPGIATITLDLLVLDAKSFRPVTGAKIIVTDADGGSFDFVSDAKGKSVDIALESGKTYTIVANMGEMAGKEIKLSTVGIKTNKKFNKTLYVASETAVVNTTYTPVEGVFAHNFTYNKTEIESNPDYTKFLSNVENAITTNGKVTVSIHSSASQVPTKSAGGNPGLAKARAENLKRLVSEYLTSKGIDLAKVKFVLTNKVGGPTYNGDYLIRKSTYEKYQFVEARIK